jgi:DNA polymerase III subunit alpha
MKFSHLHVHSEYSVLDGMIKVKDLFERARELELNSVAITDHGNIDVFVKAVTLSKEIGMKYIPGVEIYLCEDYRLLRGNKRPHYGHLNLYAKNKNGLTEIFKILGKCNELFYYKPVIDLETLYKFDLSNIIISTACTAGILNGEIENVTSKLKIMKDNCKNIFMEVMPHNLQDQYKVNEMAFALTKKLNIPVIATQDSHYLLEGQNKSHEVLLAINTNKKISDPNRFKFNIDTCYLSGAKRFKKLFDKLEQLHSYEIESAINNTQLVHELIEFDDFETYKPVINVEGYDARKFRKLILDKFEKKFSKQDKEKRKIYTDRLNMEMRMIFEKKFDSYFYVVYDALKWARKNDIMSGVGRGSVGGSLVSYVLNITGIDPIKFGLRFERFIAEDRADLPDIDTDIQHDKREMFLDHIKSKYGNECVVNISTFGDMKTKGAIRDVSRVYDLNMGDVNIVSKSIDEFGDATTIQAQLDEGNKTLKKFLKDNPKQKQHFFDLEGIVRNAGVHAAGIVIANESINNSGRGYLVKRKNKMVLNWDKDDAEKMGWVKFDFLGLNTLSVIANCLKLIKENHGLEIKLSPKIIKDEKTLKIFTDANTVGVFQFSSYKMKKLLSEMKIDSFTDLYILTALYRPGTIRAGIIDDYVKVRNGDIEADYMGCKEYKRITKETCGYIIFQEQMTDILQVAGFTYLEADKIRKICSKKKGIDELGKYGDKFIKLAVKNLDIDKTVAIEMFDNIKTFGSYCFNKSHAVGYAMTAFYTAYLKAHYYEEFMGALMTSGSQADYKLGEYLEDLFNHKYEMCNVSLKKSYGKMWNISDGKIYPPYISVKGVGETVAKEMDNIRKRVTVKITDAGQLQYFSSKRLINAKVIKVLNNVLFDDRIDYDNYSIEMR